RCLQGALQTCAALRAQQPVNRSVPPVEARTLVLLGSALHNLKRPQAALAAIRRAEESYTDLARAEPGQEDHRRQRGLARLNRGIVLHVLGQYGEARKALFQARADMPGLTPSPLPAAQRGPVEVCLVMTYAREGLFAEALAALDEARQVYRSEPRAADLRANLVLVDYNAACFCALWSDATSRDGRRPLPVRERDAEARARQALGFLA